MRRARRFVQQQRQELLRRQPQQLPLLQPANNNSPQSLGEHHLVMAGEEQVLVKTAAPKSRNKEK